MLLNYKSYPRVEISWQRKRTFPTFCLPPSSTECRTDTCSDPRTSQFRPIFTSMMWPQHGPWPLTTCLVPRVTRAVFAFAEMTNMDPGYTGPEFDFDRIVKDLMNKVRGINTSLFQEMIINEAKRLKKRNNSHKHSRAFGGNHQFKTPSRCKQTLTQFLPIWCR